ncbi:hypothetical protein [Streptomyces doebereineriae]|uniref:TetR family transcriptional regulator n=1 Tax=Streptomyces doebereineriae TaxID=3075528 RepID=A0ABU2V1M5_9ACTN|nr:hypothetical protein [Streptomyces sp. DSM 41640]MDT0479452.1 hypothetical protein [Streptomyces sp. DSM 41640]
MGRSDDIRAAALELFTRLGCEATTMADIGAALHCWRRPHGER